MLITQIVGEDVSVDDMGAIVNTTSTRGVLHVHATPQALCPHIRWALESVAGRSADLEWYPQEALPGTVRTTLEWHGPQGTGALLASALQRLRNLRFEVTEEASPGADAGRWAYTPELGIFYGMTDSLGNTVITEDRVRYAYEMAKGDPAALLGQFSLALGEAWDTELEPLRETTITPSNVRCLHRVG